MLFQSPTRTSRRWTPKNTAPITTATNSKDSLAFSCTPNPYCRRDRDEGRHLPCLEKRAQCRSDVDNEEGKRGCAGDQQTLGQASADLMRCKAAERLARNSDAIISIVSSRPPLSAAAKNLPDGLVRRYELAQARRTRCCLAPAAMEDLAPGLLRTMSIRPQPASPETSRKGFPVDMRPAPVPGQSLPVGRPTALPLLQVVETGEVTQRVESR